MPELSLIDFGLLGLMLGFGVLFGWVIRADRCGREKTSINASWQQQIDSRQMEHDRLIEQNKSLMQQISQYQSSHKDQTMRAKELSDSLNKALTHRDKLLSEVKESRGKLDAAISQRNELQTNLEYRESQDSHNAEALKKKDSKIFRLSQELENWQNRVPPLVERFRKRDEEAKIVEAELAEQARRFETELAEQAERLDNQLAEQAERLDIELAEANEQIAELSAQIEKEETRVEPVNPTSLPSDLDASNEPHAETIAGNDVPPEFRALASNNDDNSDDFDDAEYTQATANDAPATSGAATEERDDLQQIKGVGPAIEKTLNELGIYRFHQISEMSEYDIDRVAQKLRGFRSRIYREDWLGQARILRSGQSDNPI